MTDHPRCRCVLVPIGGMRDHPNYWNVPESGSLMGETFGIRYGKPPSWKRHDPLRGVTISDPPLFWQIFQIARPEVIIDFIIAPYIHLRIGGIWYG